MCYRISTKPIGKHPLFVAYHQYNRSGKTWDELIKRGVSKAGTTFAAFEVFDEYKVRKG